MFSFGRCHRDDFESVRPLLIVGVGGARCQDNGLASCVSLEERFGFFIMARLRKSSNEDQGEGCSGFAGSIP